jgi:hypothetical protein
MSDKSKFYNLFTNEDLSIINIFGIHVGDKTNMLNLLYIPITTDKMI